MASPVSDIINSLRRRSTTERLRHPGNSLVHGDGLAGRSLKRLLHRDGAFGRLDGGSRKRLLILSSQLRVDAEPRERGDLAVLSLHQRSRHRLKALA
jgi:hypothetical protein